MTTERDKILRLLRHMRRMELMFNSIVLVAVALIVFVVGYALVLALR